MFALNQLPALKQGFPDVCLTPMGPLLVPMPYPNMAQEVMGTPAPMNIFIGGAPVHNMATVIGLSMGDLPGVSGVASGLVLGPQTTLVNATTFLTGALPTQRLGSMGISNLCNVVSVACTPNQTRVLLLCA
ncbi:DUF4150 domain-containing protein [Pseudacidovorax intermedius]|uniref:Uncharacterized protein n=1 Tax=Pseudacidovorax intermedius TaxID=433924 RepID=A0A147GKY4_9BURK|nr:DUF4150 domain-containing protein [Pseudacidovorax intermedius]KTT10240.1 hypothetical protein NS331_25085 [Pseudacidovorax intermedius]